MVIRAEHRFKKDIIVNLKLCAQDMQDICALDQAEFGHGAFFDTLSLTKSNCFADVHIGDTDEGTDYAATFNFGYPVKVCRCCVVHQCF